MKTVMLSLVGLFGHEDSNVVMLSLVHLFEYEDSNAMSCWSVWV